MHPRPTTSLHREVGRGSDEDCSPPPELLKSAAENLLRMWEVSWRVNKTGAGDDDPTLVEQVPA